MQNGLRQKKDELFDHITKYNVDVILIQETHLTPNMTFKIPTYITYRNDRLSPVAGNKAAEATAIIIKNSITHKPVQTPSMNLVEATIIEVAINNQPPITIISTYIPPRNTQFPKSELNKLIQIAQNSIIAGDFNAAHHAWGNHYSSKYGKNLLNISKNNHLVILAPDCPSHILCASRYKPSIIDFALLKKIPFHNSIEVINNLSSDHLPVHINLNTQILPIEKHSSIKIDWKKFEEQISSFETPKINFNSISEAENEIENLNSFLFNAYEESSSLNPEINAKRFPLYIRQLIRDRNTFRRVYQHSRNKKDYSDIKNAQKTIKQEIIKFKEEQWEEYCENKKASEAKASEILKIISSSK